MKYFVAIVLIAFMAIGTASSMVPHQKPKPPVHHTSMYWMEHDVCATLHATTGFPTKKCKPTAR
jgi:hypothetical protein